MLGQTKGRVEEGAHEGIDGREGRRARGYVSERRKKREGENKRREGDAQGVRENTRIVGRRKMRRR